MSAEKTKMPLKAIMTINGARGLLWELVANYPFSEDDTARIIRCLKDLKNLNLMFQTEQDVANNVAKPTLQHLQAENNRLKTTLKNLKSLMLDPDCVQDRGDIYVMVRAIDEALNGESSEK